MGIAELTTELMRDAHAEADRIERDAHARADGIRQETRLLVEERTRQLADAAKRAQERDKRRFEAEAQIRTRQELLRCKQDELDRVFDEALTRAAHLPISARAKLLRALVERARRELGTSFTLRAAKRDAALLRKSARVTATIDSAGGFIAARTDGTAQADYTFERLIGEVRARDSPKVARILFGASESPIPKRSKTAKKSARPTTRRRTR